MGESLEREAGILHQILRFGGGVNIWGRIHQSKSFVKLRKNQRKIFCNE